MINFSTGISDLLNSSDLLIPELTNRIKNNLHGIGKESWVYFIPFLMSYNLFPRRSLYLLEDSGSDIIFQHLKNDAHEKLDLIVPPFPLTVKSLDWIDTFSSFVSNQSNQDSIRIIWTDSCDMNCLSDYFGNRLSVEKKQIEYQYDIQSVVDMRGHDFRDLRKAVNKIKKLSPNFREMEYKDIGRVMKLLKDWKRSQGRKNDFLLDWGYTKKALLTFSEFSKEDLYSWCIEIDNKTVGFAMAGPITANTASFFIIKTDVSISGLSLYLRWRVFKELAQFSLLNDASDLGIPGLKQHKMKLRPSGYNTTYTVSIKC